MLTYHSRAKHQPDVDMALQFAPEQALSRTARILGGILLTENLFFGSIL